MRNNYQYFFTKTAVGELCVEDTGNCFLEANNDNAEFYYLAIRTKLGITRTFEYGPYLDGLRPTMLNSQFQQFDYNEKRIDKQIYSFVNAPIRKITQAREMTEQEFKDQLDFLKNPVEYLYDNN